MKRIIQVVLALLLGAGCLWLFFRDTEWSTVWESIRRVHIGWLLAAQIPIYAAFFTRVQRWSYIVRVDHPASYRHLFNSTQIGFLVNFAVGFRSGELVRPLALSRLTNISFSKALAFNAMDRVSDFVGLIAVLVVSVAAVSGMSEVVIPKETFGMERDYAFSPTTIRTGAGFVFVLLFGLTFVFVMLYANRRLTLKASDAVLGVVSTKLAEKVHGMLDQFADGLHIFRSVPDMAKTSIFSLLTWLLNIIAAGMVFTAFGLDWPWYTPFVMQALLAVFIGAPTAPGMVGQFHLPIVISLVMVIPAIPTDEAKALAIVFHLINLVAVFILGIYALLREDLRLTELNPQDAKA